MKEKEEVTMVVSFPFSALQMPGCGFPIDSSTIGRQGATIFFDQPMTSFRSFP